MTKRLEGNVALITGGTTGIGAATARLFHAEGARVIVTGRNPATLAAAKDKLPGIEVVASDTGDPSSTERLFDHVREHHGRLDVLLLNAAVVPHVALVDLECEEFDEAMRVNVRGPWLAIKYATPLLSRGASVVLTGSTSAVKTMHGGGAYGATKAALASLARTAALELLDRGVRVNVLLPGPIDSGVIAKGRDQATVTAIEDHLKSLIPMKRLGHVDEIARVALFLASTDSSFMTGEEIVVDGGMTRL
jgi:NAD(P)-dependent dehydrogenase (short-subunit alcohol dehydrogenase family)